MNQKPYLILLVPEIFAPGGIQTYLRCLLKTLFLYAQDRGYSVRCVSLKDGTCGDPGRSLRRPPGAFVGCQGKKLVFVSKALGYCFREKPTLLVGHIRLAPLAWVFKKLGLIQRYLVLLYGIEAWAGVSWFKRQAAKEASGLVAISRYTAEEFSRHNGIRLDKIRIIPPTLAEDDIEPPVLRVRNDSEEFRVLTVGRITSEDRPKGIGELIKALGEIRGQGEKIHLTVVGEGQEESRLRDLAIRSGLDGQVEFLGFVSEEHLRELYQQSDCFALPSQKEGFGIVFLEAMRFGLPVIGGRFGGTPELITHRMDGLLVGPGDVGQLSDALRMILKDAGLRKALGERAMAKVRSQYLLAHMRQRVSELLDEAV